MMSSNAQQTSPPLFILDILITDDNKRFAPAARLAAAIIEITQEQGGCLPQDLNERGFTPEEVHKHWHMAHALADVEINLLCDRSSNLKSIIRK